MQIIEIYKIKIKQYQKKRFQSSLPLIALHKKGHKKHGKNGAKHTSFRGLLSSYHGARARGWQRNSRRGPRKTVQSAAFSEISVTDRVRKATEGRMQSIIPSVVLQVLIMVYTTKEIFESNKVNGGTTFLDSAGDGFKHRLLRGPSISLINERNWSRKPSCLTYNDGKTMKQICF